MDAKKRSVGAAERDEFPRRAWRAIVAEGTGADRFVFVDECGTNTSPRPLYAWSRRGERAPCSAPRSAPRDWGKNVTLISSMTLDGVGPSLVVEGATTGAVFEACVEEALPPGPRAGRVVVGQESAPGSCTPTKPTMTRSARGRSEEEASRGA